MNATTVLPFAPRHVTTDLGDSLRIVLPSRRRWLTIIPLVFVLLVWTGVILPIISVGSAVLSAVLEDPRALAGAAFFIIFGLVWISIWVFAGLFAFYTLLWNLAGREIIEVNPLAIRLARRVPGWGRAREYLAEHVRDLRVSPQALPDWWMRRSAWPGATLGQLAFDYGARTIRFGDCDEAEARMILAEIRQRFPQYLRSDPKGLEDP